MPNEFQFSFSAKDMEKLLADGGDRILITARVLYDSAKGVSTFEIFAENSESTRGNNMKSGNNIIGCPMPC